MGKAKKVGIIAGIVVVSFVILIAIGLSSSSANDAIQQTSKYAGLTDEQIRSVKLLTESCDNKVAEVSALYGEEHGKLVQEQCDRAIAHKIEGYRNTTTSN